MSRKKQNLSDKTVASMLNDASACGMDVLKGLPEHLADYFANPPEPTGNGGIPASSSDSDSGRFIIDLIFVYIS